MHRLHTTRFLARELSPGDGELYCGLFTDPVSMRHVARPLTPLSAAMSFRKSLQVTRQRRARFICFTVAHRMAAEPVGIGSIQRIDRTEHRAEVGLILRPRACGRGYGREILGGLIAHAFAALPVDVIGARYSAAHPAVDRMLDGLGFAHRVATTGRAPGVVLRSVTRSRWYENEQVRGGVDVGYHRISGAHGP